MKITKYKYKILIAAIITILSITLPFRYKVNAETNEERIQEYVETCDPEVLLGKYNLKIEKVPNTSNQYRIYADNNQSALGNAEFRVEKIVTGNLHGNVDSLGTVKYGQDLYMNVDSAIGSYGEKGVAVELTMIQTMDGCLSRNDEAYGGNPAGKEYAGIFSVIVETTDTQPIINQNGKPNKVDNPHIGTGKICTNFVNGVYNSGQFSSKIAKADFDAYNYAAVSNEGKNYYKEILAYCFNNKVEVAFTDDEVIGMIKSVITLWKTYSTPVGGGSQSFNDAFNSIRDAANAAGTSKGSPSSPAANSTNLSYTNKCEYNQTGRASKNYYTAQIVANEYATYTYNYAPGLERSETKKVCDVLCEEAVKVEYGAPIASKAGLCFDYTVKVESYVKCTPKYTRNEPRISYSYCTPNVLCVSQKGTVRTKPQAGPTQEFDRCIKSCDGGKYTQSCSLKCYDKVYSKNKKNMALSYENIKQNAVQKLSGGSLSTCKRVNWDGCYGVSGGHIYWSSNYYDDYDSNKLGRYYRESGYNLGLIGSGYIADDNGFSRARYANGAECSDDCEWQHSCPSNMYLNPNMSVYDYNSNVQAYQRAVSSCEAATSCSRKTATFTIAVKYDTKDGDAHTTVNKVYYPYTSNSQHKQNPTENGNEYNTISKDTFTNGNGYKNDKSTIIDYDGCYKSADNVRWYLTEWGFPGTYINNKTGEISFSVPSDLSGWYLEKKKFCIPLNAESINKKWWEWKVIGNHCISESEILSELNGQARTSNGYNIEAIAKNFGYFGWNITTKCFYAIRNEVCDTDKSASRCCPVGGGAGGVNGKEEETTGYVVRTVDPKNMFPNSNYNVADEQRRDIGYNWTEEATILSMKNPRYQVNPQELKETIEGNADILYSEEPDYQFYLTPQDLTNLRRYNDKYSYSTWNGTTSSVNGVNSYKSNLFRAVGIESNIISSTAKKIGTPGVNNE